MSLESDCWTLQIDDERIAWLTLDRPDVSLNTLHSTVMQDLDHALTTVAASEVVGLVIRSGKQAGFMVGADLKELQCFKSPDQMRTFIDLGQRVLHRLTQLSIPTVALIHGACLGGGYELALACDYRVAEQEETLLGLPEVSLGLIPAWGGTVRLMRLLGALRALPLLVLGRRLSAVHAKRLGMIDVCVPADHLEATARFFVQRQPKRQRPTWVARLASAWWIRPVWGRLIQRRLKEKGLSPKTDPAAYAVLTNWLSVGVSETGFERERETVSALLFAEKTQRLIDAFLSGKRELTE